MRHVSRVLNILLNASTVLVLIWLLISSLSVFTHKTNTRPTQAEKWFEHHPDSYDNEDSLRFNQFLWIITDHHSPRFSSRMKESFNDHGIYYHSYTPGAKFSTAVYSGWFLGYYPTNYKHQRITQQTLFDTLTDSKYSLEFYGPRSPFSNIFDLSKISANFVAESHSESSRRAFSWILGDNDTLDMESAATNWNEFLNEKISAGKSLILHSSVYSENEHIRPGYHPIDLATAKRIDSDLIALKNWSLSRPDVLVIISNDHHIGFNGDTTSYNDDKVNDPYFIFYNPKLPGNSERFIHSCDFAANFVQYLNKVEIPVASIGIPNLDGESSFRIENSLRQASASHLLNAKTRGIKLKNRLKLEAQIEKISDFDQATQNLLISRRRLSSRTSLPVIRIIFCYLVLIFASFNLISVPFLSSNLVSNLVKRFNYQPATECPVESIVGGNRSVANSEQIMILQVPKFVVIFTVLIPFSFLILPKTPSISCTDLVDLVTPLLSLIAIYYLPYFYRSKITQIVIIDAFVALFWRFLGGDDLGSGAFDQFLNGKIISHIFYLIYFLAIFLISTPQNVTPATKIYHDIKLIFIFVILFFNKIFLDTKNFSKMYFSRYQIQYFAFFTYITVILYIVYLVFSRRRFAIDILDIISPIFLLVFILLSEAPTKQVLLLYVVFKWVVYLCPILSTLRCFSSLFLNLRGFLKVKVESFISPKQSILSLSHLILSDQNISYFLILICFSVFMALHDLFVTLPFVPSFSVFIPGGKVGLRSAFVFQNLSFIGMILHDYGVFLIILLLIWSSSSSVFELKRSKSKPVHKIFAEFNSLIKDSPFYTNFTAVFPFNILLCPNHYFITFLFTFAMISNILLLNILKAWHSEINFEIPFAINTLLTISTIIIMLLNGVTYAYRSFIVKE